MNSSRFDEIRGVRVWHPPGRWLMVMIFSRDDGSGKTNCEVEPVLAFEARTVRRWWVNEANRRFPASSAARCREGWKFTPDEVEHVPIVKAADGIGEPYAATEGMRGRASLLVQCDWPSGEDVERLKEAIARLTEEAESVIRRELRQG